VTVGLAPRSVSDPQSLVDPRKNYNQEQNHRPILEQKTLHRYSSSRDAVKRRGHPVGFDDMVLVHPAEFSVFNHLINDGVHIPLCTKGCVTEQVAKKTVRKHWSRLMRAYETADLLAHHLKIVKPHLDHKASLLADRFVARPSHPFNGFLVISQNTRAYRF